MNDFYFFCYLCNVDELVFSGIHCPFVFCYFIFVSFSKPSNPFAHEKSVWVIACIQDAQIYNTFSVWEPILTVMSSFLLQTGCCSWHLFSAAIGSWIFSNMESVMVSPGSLRRSSSSCIQASPILLVTLLWSLLFLVLFIFHKLDFGEFFCIIIIKMIIANFIHSWYNQPWWNKISSQTERLLYPMVLCQYDSQMTEFVQFFVCLGLGFTSVLQITNSTVRASSM